MTQNRIAVERESVCVTCVKSFITKKLPAFSLAEVLLTLTVIGVIATLVIPTFIAKQRDIKTV